ncbi:MAG: hypothetical protein K2Y08_06730 [Alphaproteobacteria bacterium]|nr:hypothetical protein [Alphaproteobacteria bacterium]
MTLRRQAFSSIFSIDSLDEVTREGLRNLIVTLLNDEEFTDPQEILKMISILPWEERYQLYAKLALKEGIPMTLRRQAFSSIFSIDSLDEVTRRRLGNLKATFLSDEELTLQERLKFLPNANEAAPSVTTLLSLTQALESANEGSYNESDLRSLISFLMQGDNSENQIGIERCYFKQPALFLDDSVWKEWFHTTLETGDESKRTSMLQKLCEVLHSTENEKKVTAAKLILLYSQDAEDKETALEVFISSVQELIERISEIPQESFLKEKSNIGEACALFMSYAPEDKVHLLRALSDDMFQQVRAEISAITDPQERLQAINSLNDLIRYTLLADLALQESMPKDIRRAAFSSVYLTDSLDDITREKLKSLKPAFLNDEELPLTERLTFLPNPEEEAPPVATLLSLMRALEAEDGDSLDLDDEVGYKYTLYHFLAECPDPEVQQRLENYYFNHPITTALYLKEWLNDFYQRSEESQKTLILQKMQEAMQQSTDMTFDIITAAKFLLKHSQGHEVATQTLWKLVEKQTSNDSEESAEEGDEEEENYEKTDTLITICRTLLKYAPPSPVRESVLGRLFTEAEQELSPRALLLLLTQEEPSISTRARELGEQRLQQDNLDYTLDLFFDLEQEKLEQDLRHKIQERLKAKFNDSTTDKNVLLRLALAFLRATDENLSQKAFDYLKQVLINNYNDLEDPEIVVYQIIRAVGVDHPWAQEVINIGIGIEQIDHPFSAIGAYRQLLEKIKEPVIHHPSSTRLDDGRFVTFNIETLQTPRLLSHILPVQHSEFMVLVEGLRQEVRENKAPKKEFSTISKNISAKTLVNKANEHYFKNLLDSEAGHGVISLISFKLRRLITDIIALKTETQTATESSTSSSSMATGPSTALSKNGLSPASKAIAQLLINVMQCDTNKDDGIDNTYRLLGYEKVISEEGMREERLITTAHEHIKEDLRQMREGLLDGEGPVVKELLFGTRENHDKEVNEPPHQGKYLNNLLGGELGSFLKGQSISYDLYGGCVEEKLRSYTKQQILDTLHRHFKPEKVIERYHERFNKDGGKGRPTNLISTLMGEEMMKDTPEGKKEVNDKYSTFDPETWEFKEYTPLLVAEVLLRLNILREVQPPSLTIGVPVSSSSMAATIQPSSSTLPSEDSDGRP